MAGGLIQGGGSELARQATDYYNSYGASIQVGASKPVTLVLLSQLTVPEAGRSITPLTTSGKSGILR